MPLIVDKEAVRKEILMAFERCIEKKPMTKITLRDIAEEAGMSHPKLLHYFENRDDLVVSYLRYTKDYMTEKNASSGSRRIRVRITTATSPT